MPHVLVTGHLVNRALLYSTEIAFRFQRYLQPKSRPLSSCDAYLSVLRNPVAGVERSVNESDVTHGDFAVDFVSGVSKSVT